MLKRIEKFSGRVAIFFGGWGLINFHDGLGFFERS